MTVWHDQPPLSRRQVRENSPAEAEDAPPADEGAVESAPRRSAGRRVQWDPSAAPDDDASPGDASPGVDSPAAEEPGHDAPAPYRVRDYRPDIRRAAFAPLGSAAPQDGWSPPEDPTAAIAAEHAAFQAEPAAPEYTMTRRALRELRQRAEAAGQEAPIVVRDANGALALTGSIPVVDLPRDDDGQIVDEQQVEEQQAGEQQVEEQQVGEQQHDRIPIEVLVAEEALASAMIDEATVSEATIVEIVEIEHIVEIDEFDGDTLIPAPIAAPGDAQFETIHALIEPDSAPAPEQFEALSELQPESLRPFDALFLPPASEAGASNDGAQPLLEHDGGRGVEPAPDAAPYGHWSSQAALDDASQTNESPLSRNVGTAGAITTHALVLPSGPSSQDQLLNPVTLTGEIMVTGSIDLPRSFGTTGAHPALFDHPDVDALIEESDREDAVSESAPVRAIRAVSSNSSTRGVIEAPAPRKSRLPLIAGITGGSALLVAAGVVAAGFIFNVF